MVLPVAVAADEVEAALEEAGLGGPGEEGTALVAEAPDVRVVVLFGISSTSGGSR